MAYYPSVPSNKGNVKLTNQISADKCCCKLHEKAAILLATENFIIQFDKLLTRLSHVRKDSHLRPISY